MSVLRVNCVRLCLLAKVAIGNRRGKPILRTHIILVRGRVSGLIPGWLHFDPNYRRRGRPFQSGFPIIAALVCRPALGLSGDHWNGHDRRFGLGGSSVAIGRVLCHVYDLLNQSLGQASSIMLASARIDFGGLRHLR